jgi:hypothetical protein
MAPVAKAARRADASLPARRRRIVPMS